MRYKIFVLFLICLFLFSGCLNRQDQVPEDVLQKNLVTLFQDYKTGVNKLDRTKLQNIISEGFHYSGGNREDYLQDLFSWTFFIEKIDYANVRIEDYKIFTDTTLKGSLVFKPQVKIPLFKTPMPLLSGRFEDNVLFVLAYEKDKLKILAQEQGLLTKDFVWGKILPELTTFSVDKYSAAPGDTVTVKISADKGAGNDVSFVFVGDHLLSGYSDRGEVPYNEDTYVVKIPSDFPRGNNFDINAMVFAGKLELGNPQQAELQGIIVKTISLPIR